MMFFKKKKHILIFILFALSMLIPLSTYAEEAETSHIASDEEISLDFKNSAKEYLFKIQKLGIESLQGKKIVDIIKDIESSNNLIVLEQIKFEKHDDLNTSRNCAYWDEKLHAIFISKTNWSRLSTSNKQSLAIHEFFGLLGIKDNNFELTSLFDAYWLVEKLYTRSPDKIDLNALNAFRKVFDQKHFLMGGGGGVSGVGGGGDTRPQSFKTTLISLAFTSLNFKEISEVTFFKIISIYQAFEVEFSDDLPQGEYLLDLNKFSILIPNNAFSMNNSKVTMKMISNLNDRIISMLKVNPK